MGIRHARDVPEARSRLLRWLEHDAADLLAGADLGGEPGDRSLPPVVDRARDTGADAAQAAHVYAQWVAEGIRAARLYYVSEEFTDLAESASRTLPDFGVHRQMMPSESGLLCWARPIGGLQPWPHVDSVRAVAASWRATEEGVFVQLYDDATQLVLHRPPGEREGVLAELGWLTQAQAWMLPWSQPVVLDPPEHRPPQMTTPMVALITSWLLMGQTITTAAPERITGRDARRIARRGHPVGDVDYVALRRAAPPADGDPATDASEHAYRNRWIVDGHWRRQWHPSAGEHRPIWISAHIKGPPGAPLLTRERVYTLRQ